MLKRKPPSPATIPHLLFFNEARFSRCLREGEPPISVFKDAIAGANTQWDNRFREGESIRKLVNERAVFMDRLLHHAWNLYNWDARIALVAVGGYGRGELHPHSDIDILILTNRRNATRYRSSIEAFLAFLWDIQLQVGHSVRTLGEATSMARQDITVMTNLLETRTIVGDRNLMHELRRRTAPEKIWPAAQFFQAKYEEQRARHARHGIDEYDMEPNIKESPGGLRDIQTINWVTKRYFRVSGLEELANRGFYTEEEYNSLRSGEYFLWQVRYGLHMLTGRAQDKLLFDHQRQLAEMFGFHDTDEKLGVEQFMQRYYIIVMALREINDVLMQYLEEQILVSSRASRITPVNERFRLRDGYLEPVRPGLFREQPSTMLEIFVLLASDASINGIQSTAIRELRECGYLIDDAFRQRPENRALFIELLRAAENLPVALQKMSRYAVLGRYLPEFGRIVGHPQHDLFHIYPVDVHTLQVIFNIRHFATPEAQQEFPLSSHVYRNLRKPELLTIAGLYHDIAKGRGGDHSELGAEDITHFARDHGYPEDECELLAWLVENHLLMSRIAQREDISDPGVVADFANHVGDQEHLDLLYALTVADIRATNPQLWNSWRSSLLRQLYQETSRALRRGPDNPIARNEVVTDTRQDALDLLQQRGVSVDRVRAFWSTIDDDYFQREFAEEIAWQTESILSRENPSETLVAVRTFVLNDRDRATELLVRTVDTNNVFAAVANAIDQLNLSILDARLYTTRGMTLDIFYLLDEFGQPLDENSPQAERLCRVVTDELGYLDEYQEVIRRRTPRRLKQFPVSTKTTLTRLEHASLLEVITADRPGLLATIGRIFVQYNIRLLSAKIPTLGERVEDLFIITNADGEPIDDPQLAAELQRSIRETIDQRVDALQH